MRRKAKVVDHGAAGRDTLSQLTEQQWLDLLNRVTLFIKSRYFNVDGGDLINEAIAAVLEGRRGWDTSKPPFDNLCSIVSSVASNHFAKEKRFIPLDGNVEAPPITDTALSPPPASSQATMYERRVEDRLFSARLYQKLGEHRLSKRIVDYLMENLLWKPHIIARDLQVETKDINNSRKRIVRALKALKESEKEAL